MEVQSEKIKQLSLLIHDRMGLHFTVNKHKDLIHGIDRSAKILSYSSTHLFVDFLLTNKWDKVIIETLGSELTIGETYFFRDRAIFNVIENYIIPEKSQEKNIKFWSAACSTGEEPYSIAVTLDRMIPDINNWDIKIVATDINKNSLQKAKEGVYRQWSFRDSKFSDREDYFMENDAGDFEISHKVKGMVDFSLLNLIAQGYPSILNGTSDCDVIFCRNVLIYFSLITANKVIKRLYDCLKPGGFLILSAVELALVPENLFELIELSGNLLLRKPLTSNDVSHLFQFNPTSGFNCPPCSRASSIASKLASSIVNSPMLASRRNELHKDNNKTLKDQSLNIQHKKKRDNKREKNKIKVEVVENNQDLILNDDRYKKAELLADRGKYDDSIKMCLQGIKESPLCSRWNYLYGVVLFESDMPLKAVKAITRVIYLNPDNIMAHIMLGHINDALGKETRAKKSFKNALMLLRNLKSDDIVNESGGLNADRLTATIKAVYDGR